MSETHECEKARHLFCEFLHELDACQPTCTGLYGTDSLTEDPINVDRAD
ncbi:hypothetical protein LCGC14_2581690, partial [marine sediment metagenome]